MAKATVEGLRFIDVQDWHRRGLLKSGKGIFCEWQSNRVKNGLFVGVESQRVLLWHLIRGPGRKYQQFRETVYLDFSPCNRGGKRPWFLCPSCNRRVVVLYHCGYFGCRRCHRLAYKSQQVSKWERPVHRIRQIRTRLGGRPDILGPFPPKPPRMRCSTYQRLESEERKAQLEHLTAMGADLSRLEKSAL
jgi:hypothetical protein